MFKFEDDAQDFVYEFFDIWCLKREQEDELFNINFAFLI